MPSLVTAPNTTTTLTTSATYTDADIQGPLVVAGTGVRITIQGATKGSGAITLESGAAIQFGGDVGARSTSPVTAPPPSSTRACRLSVRVTMRALRVCLEMCSEWSAGVCFRASERSDHTGREHRSGGNARQMAVPGALRDRLYSL